MTPPLALPTPATPTGEEQLLALVLDGMSSPHSRRAYAKGLQQFFLWLDGHGSGAFTKALVQSYRSALLDQGLSAATVNLRLSPIRKLAREMADNGLLDPALAAAIARVPGVEQRGIRAGNWLLKEQASELLQAPDPATLKGKRDRAILALLLGCGLRRAELVRLRVEDLEQREGRWVIPDMAGKGKRVRTVPVPAPVKVRIDEWLEAASIQQGPLFRPVNRGDAVSARGIADEKAIWHVVVGYARRTALGKLAPHDLRRTCARLCRKAGGDLEQIQFLLGHASIQTTERYLGAHQQLATAVNDGLGLEWE
jgi:site-specific recombinase XerD